MIEALSLDLDWIPTDLNRLLTSSANNRVRTNAAEAPAITVIQFQSSAYFLARTLGPLAATGTPARTDELLEKKLKQILAASLPAIKHKISISRLQDYDAGKPETQLTFKYYQEVTHLLWPHLPKIEQLQGTSRNTCLDASTSCITFFGQIIDDHIASLQALDNPQSTLQRDLLPSFMTLKRALEQVRLHLPPRAPLDADQALHSTFDSASGSDNLLEEQIEVVLTSSAEVTPKLQNVATDEHFKELIGKINQLLPSKESIEAAKQEKKFDKINKALDTGKKLGVLAGSIAAYCGDAQTGEQIELIVGSTVEIGLALVAAYTGGPIGWVNAGITVVGTVLKILNFYNKPKTPSAEEIISSQIAHLSEQVNQHFKQVETMLSEMYKDVFTWFSSLREDIRRLDREIKDVRGKLDPIHAKIEALFTKEYFDNRFNALSFHQLFDQDMNLDDQIRYFQVFRNCALLDSQRHANQPDQRGIVNQLKDPIDGGMERNIPVLVDYARRYLGFNGVRPDECINPLFWAEGGLSLIEFFDRTPEFNLTPKIKAGCDEILEEGRKFNQLTASLHTLGVVRRVVELYSASLDELLATLGNMPAPDEPFHKVEDSFFENTFRAGVGHYYTYDHYVTYRDKLIERLKTSDDLLQEVEKAHVLTLTFFALCYREQFLYDPDVRACLAALWNAAQVREWLQSYQNAVYGSTIATVQAYHTQLKQQYYGGTQLEKYDVYQAVKLRFGLIEQL
ncbi:MAG: hypothetical protein JOZ51_13330, partial [Chloroflexi bacterium]|nr:hypothetical protein [Chloroflexota bacterium]